MSAPAAPVRHLRLVGAPGPAESLGGPEKRQGRTQGGDRDQADAAQSAILSLLGRVSPDLTADQALVEVERTVAEFEARCAVLDVLDDLDSDVEPLRRAAWLRVLALYLVLAGPPLVGTACYVGTLA